AVELCRGAAGYVHRRQKKDGRVRQPALAAIAGLDRRCSHHCAQRLAAGSGPAHSLRVRMKHYLFEAVILSEGGSQAHSPAWETRVEGSWFCLSERTA